MPCRMGVCSILTRCVQVKEKVYVHHQIALKKKGRAGRHFEALAPVDMSCAFMIQATANMMILFTELYHLIPHLYSWLVFKNRS